MSDFRIEIETVLKGNPVSELESLQVAIKDALGSYAQMEKQLAKSTKQLASTREQIGSVREQLEEARAGGDTAGVEKLEAKLAKLIAREQKLVGAAGEARAALQNQESEIRELAGSLEELRAAEESSAAAADESAQGQRDLKAGLKGLGGPLGETISTADDLADTWRGLVTQMGGAGPAAAGIAAAAFAALGVAIASAYVALLKFGVGQANAARDMRLSLEATYESESAAMRLTSAFGRITSETGATSERLAELSKELKDANVPIGDMPKALKAIAMQEAAIGTDNTQELIDSLKEGKKSAGEMADEMEKKFGTVVRKRMLGLDQQSIVLQQHIANLFKDINIESILSGIARLVALLDGTTESGKAVKAIVETMFTPLADQDGVFVQVERFMLGMEIGAMRTSIAIRKIGNALDFDTSGLEQIVDLAAIGEGAFYALAAVVGVVVAAFAVFGAYVGNTLYTLKIQIDAVASVFSSLAGQASAVASAITTSMQAVSAWFQSVDLSSLGSAMIDGLVQGIKAGADAVAGALKGVVDGAVGKAKQALGIKSPSRVMAEIGGYTAEGFVVGVDDGAADAQASMEALVAPPDPAVAGMGGQGGGLNFAGATFVFHGVADAEQATVRFEEMLVGLLEGQLLQAGSAA